MARIIEVQADEAATLLTLLGQVQDLHVRAHPDIFRCNVSFKERENFLREFISREAVTALAYCSADGTTSGYLIYEVQSRGESVLKAARQIGFLHQIAVDKAKRGHGLPPEKWSSSLK